VSACPFSCAKDGKVRYPMCSVSDIGKVSEKIIEVNQQKISFEDMCDWVT